jgi:PPOX class probable F420-dependent enzyme
VTEHIPLNPQHLDAEKVVLLQTRKRDGSWVDTPVNIAVQGDRAYFRTPGRASKNKRLRNFPEVQIRALYMVGQANRRPYHDGARPAAVR